jgi:hypothetical protein
MLGTRIGTYQTKLLPNTLSNVEFRFKAESDGPIDIKFVTRNGAFTIAEIELVANKETGFSPNYTRIFKRVPTEHLNTPLTFKFQYFDYESKQAELESIVYGAIFDGDNTYIEGTNNLITGSIFISDEIGTGLEIAGTNSGFIRSVGFRGVTKALANTGSAAGILFYSGSILPSVGSEFVNGGVGFQAAVSKQKYIRLNSGEDEFEIVTPGFKFISGKGNESVTNITGSFSVSGSVYIDSGSLYINGNRQFNYGAFSDTTDQTVSATVSASFTFNTIDADDGVTVVSNSRLTVPSTGIYNVQFSAQLFATAGADTVYIWLKKNGTNVPNTAGASALDNNQQMIVSWNWVLPLNANDYVEIAWQSDAGNARLEHFAAVGNVPAVPSIIVTVTQVA